MADKHPGSSPTLEEQLLLGGDLDDSTTQHISPTLEEWLQQGNKPPGIVCAQCPLSVWAISSKDLSCYCRLMHRDTFPSQRSNQTLLTRCDGALLTDDD